MTEQYLYGYRLSHADGSRGRWSFVNDNSLYLSISIRLSNGVQYTYNGSTDSVYDWAANRELQLESCCFEVRGAQADSWEQLEFYPHL